MPEPAGPETGTSAAPPPVADPSLPRLPERPPEPIPPLAAARSAGRRTYRHESERERLLRRQANPWWRTILRTIVAGAILAGVVVAAFFAVDAVTDYLDRDRLPSPGVDSADVLSATYVVQSGPAAGGLAGDITVDHSGGAYRFQGAAATDLAGVEVVGDAGGRLALRRDGGAWELGWSDPRAPQLIALAGYLGVVDTDDVLTTTWRDGYVAIEDRETDVPVAGVDETTMYTMAFDAARYAADHPFQWNEWVATVLPVTTPADDTLITVWVDGDGVIRAFDSVAAGLRWERVTYSPDALSIEFPIV